ncbi:MAG: 50S ribosomal protein L15 [Alphaproteobacteria bacterium]|nr:50S ribosomal protein L15 [Alphaproteobacteria bacterium]
MKLNALKPNAGAKKKRMRVGRGIGSGKGKTSGRGGKGQTARTGVAIGGFEGGQTPLYRRLPKSGFNNTAFAADLVELTLGRLQTALDAKKIDTKGTVDEDALVKAGVIRRKREGVKIIGAGAFKSKIALRVSKISAGARAAIEKAGGSVELIERVVAPVKRPQRNK